MCFIQSYTKAIKMNFLLRIQRLRLEKVFFPQLTIKIKPKSTPTIKHHPQISRTKNKIFIDLSQRNTKRWGWWDMLGNGVAPGRDWGIQYCMWGG